MTFATYKKFIPYVVLFAALCLSMQQFTHYLIWKDIPPFLAEMEETLPQHPRLVARLGEDALFEVTFNQRDLASDSLPYTFSLRGTEGKMRITGYAIKKHGQWVPVHSDTLFTR
ncbi:hypothetical protein K3G63_14870 [Hymenobacter sp. HSC-4F20]|uniref:hypothetical protein n=1 Tax=Hymenobacter sp. HSC-4F20 TaxID=2864135 RepID=UPI001C730B60|nr:hypothetical protein [Hymenobacter sp. HSC-4F20]MBX0291731.1 hypothetical protein [Hymenobacter sp. HSC-4F20]